METLSSIILIILACQVLTGCNAFNAEHGQQSANALAKGKDTCGRRHFEGFVDTPFDDINLGDDFSVKYGQMDNGSGVWKWKNRTYFLRVLDPRTILPGEDMVITADYSPKRLNVDLTEDGTVRSLSCG